MRDKTENIVIAGIPIEVTRKNCKNMSIKIRMNDASVAMSVPRRTPEQEVERFVLLKYDWIIKNLAKANQRIAEYPAPATQAEKDALRADLRRRIEFRLPIIEEQTGLKCSGWTIRDMHTRWGSCNTKTNHINLSLMLAQRSDEELDYVIVHELVHTKVDNHGPEFYAAMDRILPGWREIRCRMKN